jgi:hypothetical protein
MFCRSLLTITLVALHTCSAAAATVAGGPQGCVIFDINWNLLAFGFNGKDYNAGTQDTWTSTTPAEDITASNRPPFNSANAATCFLAQFYNAIYVLNADKANPTSIYIYAVSTKSWSMQSVTVTSNTVNYTNFAAILDHDTNVIYAYSEGYLSSLDMGSLTTANSTPIPWVEAQQVDLSNDPSGPISPGANTAGYQPVMALAQNHIHFFGVPGLPAGDVKIFVIHFSYMQPAPQSMGSFPNSHGKTASLFLESGVQQQIVFIPDDGSATYLVNVESNTTQTLAGPSTKDPFATYSASTTALVQLTLSGEVSFLLVPNGTTWGPVSSLPKADFSTSSSNTSSSASGTATGATSSSTGSPSTGSNGTSSGIRAVGGGMQLAVGMALAVLLGFVALVL